jgi:H-type lectin domain
MFRLRASPDYLMTLCSTALFVWPSLAAADELLHCNAERDTGKRLECLEKNIETLQKQTASNLVQTGSTTFGQNQSGTPSWPFQDLLPSGGTSWTSPRIQFAQSFATKPVVYIAIGGVRSGANLDIDQLGYSIEPTDISETGFAVIIRRTHGLLYDVAVNWIALGPKRP